MATPQEFVDALNRELEHLYIVRNGEEETIYHGSAELQDALLDFVLHNERVTFVTESGTWQTIITLA